MLVVVVALRRQHRAVGVHEANGSEGRVEDLAHEMNIGLVGIEVERRCTDFQCVLAGNDRAGTHGNLTGPVIWHVLTSRLDDVVILVREVARGWSRNIRRECGPRQKTGSECSAERGGDSHGALEQWGTHRGFLVLIGYVTDMRLLCIHSLVC